MFKLTIVTPERKILINQEIDEVTLPGFKGELNILPGHAPLITILETGIIKWKLAGVEQKHEAVVSGGYCQVSPEGVNVLANTIDLREEIDVQQRTQMLADADKKLLNETLSEDEFEGLMKEMARSRAALELAQKPQF